MQSAASPRSVAVGGRGLPGTLIAPARPSGLVIFAHGSGSSRLSPRNVHVAERLAAAGHAALLFDLLTPHEAADRRNVFDIALLAERVGEAVAWAAATATAALPIGLFGASTGAGAALVAAAQAPDAVAAVVSRGGRPDLAAPVLDRVRAPTLLIVGGEDHAVIDLNRRALDGLAGEKRLEIVAGASHLFEEPGTLERVCDLAAAWFGQYLQGERA